MSIMVVLLYVLQLDADNNDVVLSNKQTELLLLLGDGGGGGGVITTSILLIESNKQFADNINIVTLTFMIRERLCNNCMIHD